MIGAAHEEPTVNHDHWLKIEFGVLLSLALLILVQAAGWMLAAFG